MSRNKDIAFLHKVTGEPYSVCRTLMKTCNWDLSKAMMFPSCFDTITDLIRSLNHVFADMCEAVGNLYHSVGDACYSVADNLRENEND